MPTASASTLPLLYRLPVGFDARSAAEVAFPDIGGPILVPLKVPATMTVLTGDFDGEATGSPSVGRAAGVVHVGLPHLEISIQVRPAIANLKTGHGGVGVRARVQPGEPATGSAMQVVSPRVEAVESVVVDL